MSSRPAAFAGRGGPCAGETASRVTFAAVLLVLVAPLIRSRFSARARREAAGS
jgi:hypothetical protein